MNQEIKQRWIEALRSGEYKQGYEYLCNCGTFCCLGVLTDLYIKEHGFQWKRNPDDIRCFEGHLCLLPESVQKWAGIRGDMPVILGESAISYNDEYRYSFDKIANLIEEDKEL